MWGKLKDETGSAMVIVAISLSVIMALCALVLDYGRVSIEKTKLQNAVDASVLAAAQDLPDANKATNTANKYIELNGADSSDINVTFLDSNNKIKITASKKIEYTFAKIMGSNDVTITQTATGMRGKMGGAFDYALFSGDTYNSLNLNGSSFNITGSAHSNNSLVINCSNTTITGVCEAVSGITIHGSKNNIHVPNQVPNAQVVDMPDFSSAVKIDAQNKGYVYTSSVSFNQPSVIIDKPMYVYGDVTFNAGSVTVKGTLCATGNITFNGKTINASSQDPVCYYSQNGNITANCNSFIADGILYAPKGSINFNGSSFTINGRVVGKTVSVSSSNTTITAGTKDLNCLPSTACMLSE